jgi:TolB-like protein/DNA-binding winged helix-turn-helix (wHTH) protein
VRLTRVTFGIFEFDCEAHELRKQGRRIRLREQPLQLLQFLIERAGQVVTREELRQRLWPSNVYVDFDHGLNNAIATLRQALGDSSDSPHFIETLPRVGYRFIFPLTQPAQESNLIKEVAVVPPASDSPPSKEIKDVSSPYDPSIAASSARSKRGAPSRRMVVLVVVLLSAAVAYAVMYRAQVAKQNAAVTTRSMSKAAVVRNSIAVLPFANLTGDASKEYLGDGMAEAMINMLTKVPGLKVPARTSTFAYKGRNIDIRRIAKDLGVDTILEGGVQAAGKRIRITAQLINAQDGLHLWSETYDEEFTDIFKLQDKLAAEISQALQPNLSGSAAMVVAQAQPTQDVEAYRLYLQGWSLANRPSEQNVNRAIEYFQQAITRDPKFAEAYDGLADAHMATLLESTKPTGQDLLEHCAAAERAARQALALNPKMDNAHNVLAGLGIMRGQVLEMETHDRAALSLDANDGFIRIIRSAHLGETGRSTEMLKEAQKAYSLAPANPTVVGLLAYTYSVAGRDDEAFKYAELAIELGYPRDSLANVYGFAALRAKRYGEAVTLLNKTLALSDPEWARTAEVMRLVYAALADPAQRSAALAARTRLYPKPDAAGQLGAASVDAAPCLASSFNYALLGELDVAYDLANQCLDQVVPRGILSDGSASADPFIAELRPFRRDARFQALATRLGLMAYWQQYGPPDDCDLQDGKLTCH